MVQPTNNPQAPDDLLRDEQDRALKKASVGNMRFETFLNSVSKVTSFIAGPLFGIGLGMAAPTLFGTAGGIMAGIAALTTAAPMAVGVLAAGLLFAGAAITADYISSRIYQGCQFDNNIINADSTARHIVTELKANNMCVTQHEEPAHQQNSEWAKYVEARRQQQTAATR